MATQVCTNSSVLMVNASVSHPRRRTIFHQIHPLVGLSPSCYLGNPGTRKISISTRCSAKPIETLRTCKNCKTQFDPSLNHPRACRYHTAHFGGKPISFMHLIFPNSILLHCLYIHIYCELYLKRFIVRLDEGSKLENKLEWIKGL